MEIIVGRKGEQPFAITDKSVSGKHIKLTTMPKGMVQVEDLGSTNGTFIGDLRILKKTVPVSTTIRLGHSFELRLSDVLSQTPQSGMKRNSAPETIYDEEVIQRFAKLQEVWNKYTQDKIELQSGNAKQGAIRMMPMSVATMVSVISPVAGMLARGVAAATNLALTKKSSECHQSLISEMEMLNQQLQIDYVCPKCKSFLGFTPFQALVNKGKCPHCKTPWEK